MIINDPVFGFIEIPKGLLTFLVKHPYFIRLTRLKQLGPTFYVYPGAMHTRFLHSLGTYYLVSQAIQSLSEKGIWISEEEREGVQAAMLLHDLGHGPMSHALEKTFVADIAHEEVSLMLMERINKEIGGKLDLAIRIFKDEYPKLFLHELICSQLDMDRLDYLCRDSFFTGVREGNIGVARIIKMLDVKDDRLVVEEKGIYTLENYLMARRLMYWQVYLHKTALAAQEVLIMTIRRAKELVQNNNSLPCSRNLLYFLKNNVNKTFCKQNPKWIDQFVLLDDSDVNSALKQWINAEDKILSSLSDDFINRRLFKVKEMEHPISTQTLKDMRKKMASIMSVTEKEAKFLVRTRETDQMLYSTKDDDIRILLKDGNMKDISEFPELLTSNLFDKESRRYHLFYQRCKGLFPSDT